MKLSKLSKLFWFYIGVALLAWGGFAWDIAANHAAAPSALYETTMLTDSSWVTTNSQTGESEWCRFYVKDWGTQEAIETTSCMPVNRNELPGV